MIDEKHPKLSKIQYKSPILLIGNAAKVFRAKHSSEILKPQSYDDLKKLLFTDINLLVFEFNSFLSNTPSLDMFLFECKIPIIILAEDTNIDTNFLSNIRTIIKISDKSKSKLIGAKQAQEEWKVTEDKSNILNYIAYSSPELYYYKNLFSMNKYIDLFSSE